MSVNHRKNALCRLSLVALCVLAATETAVCLEPSPAKTPIPAKTPVPGKSPSTPATTAQKGKSTVPKRNAPAAPVPVPSLPADRTEWQAAEQAPEPEIFYQWVNSRGEIEKSSWKKKAEILWKNLAANERSKLRVWFQAPPGLKITSIKSAHGEVASGPAIRGAPWPGTVIEWTSSNAENSLDLAIQDSSGKTQEKSLVVDNDQSTTAYVSDPSCREAGVRFFTSPAKEAKRSGGVKDLFVGARCEQAANGAIRIRWDYVGAEKLALEGAIRALRSSAGVLETETTLPARYDGSPLLLGRLRVGETENTVYLARTKNQRWSVSVGLGATYINYQEPASQVHLLETGLTGKINVSFRLTTNLDLSGNVFATLLPLTVSPQGLAPAHFWGVNARAGYVLKRFSALTLSASLGYYLMGLATSGDYGFSTATGPQIFLVASSAAGAKRTFAAYLKYSALSNGFSLTPANHELAGGGAIQIARLWERPLSVTFDLSQMSFSTADDSQSFQSITASLGLQLRL